MLMESINNLLEDDEDNWDDDSFEMDAFGESNVEDLFGDDEDEGDAVEIEQKSNDSKNKTKPAQGNEDSDEDDSDDFNMNASAFDDNTNYSNSSTDDEDIFADEDDESIFADSEDTNFNTNDTNEEDLSADGVNFESEEKLFADSEDTNFESDHTDFNTDDTNEEDLSTDGTELDSEDMVIDGDKNHLEDGDNANFESEDAFSENGFNSDNNEDSRTKSLDDIEDANSIDEDDFDDDIDAENNSDEEDNENEDSDDDDFDDEDGAETDFINGSGNIVVQDTSDDSEEGFNLEYVDINKIAITHRIRNQSLDESLLKSIKSTGLLQPLTVAPTATEGMYVLLDGFRRIQACANAGITRVPCIVNNRVSTPEIPIIEAMYNIYRDYSIKEKIDCMDDWDKNHGMRNPGMIEMLLKLNNGDYTKIQDILTDNDEDIVTKLIGGEYDIATAFRKLEQRRKKESAEEKDKKKAEQVYGDESESGIDKVQGKGEEGDANQAMSADELESLANNVSNMDEAVEDASLNDMVEEGKQVDGYEPHKQEVGHREILDPAIKKAALARDNFTCRACKRGGEQYVDVLDAHHAVPVYLGGVDSVDNTVMLCVACHRLVHLYATGDLTIPEALLKEGGWDELDDKQRERYDNEQIFIDEQQRFKRIVYLGGIIRKKVAEQGKTREQYKKEHPNDGIGRRLPGKNSPQNYD